MMARMRGRIGAAMGLAALLAVAACGPGAAPAASGAAPAGDDAASVGGGGARDAVAERPATASTAMPAPRLRLTANYAARGSGHSGFWLAYEGGYFREQGLDVELTNIGSTAPSIQAMVAGEVQIAGLDPGATIQATLGG